VLHRLDYNTSGLLLFAKRRDVVPGVAAAFRCAAELPCCSGSFTYDCGFTATTAAAAAVMLLRTAQ
jgi:hypothetical protein